MYDVDDVEHLGGEERMEKKLAEGMNVGVCWFESVKPVSSDAISLLNLYEKTNDGVLIEISSGFNIRTNFII